MNNATNSPREAALEEALINLAKKSYIALMNTDIEQASYWYEMIHGALALLGPDRADRAVKLIMADYLNSTRKFSSEIAKKVRNKQQQENQDGVSPS